jgi:hypothetical protein
VVLGLEFPVILGGINEQYSALYKVSQTVDVDRTLSSGQVHKISFALPMPKPGEMPTSAFFGNRLNPHSGIWSVSTEIDCNAVTLSAGETFQLSG